ncbi:biotin/lipoate--protein ligase family protein, partial [Methylobacterium sp. J-090]|uniref:biotin/lipoate--protein ligase family protein n=1 Tax=Methylobacterium sp. J-090 TaxID=2836666 RepID=UPI001FBA64EB
GRLDWPKDCAEEAVPDWLVFSAMVIVSKSHLGDPGLTPDSTALDEEGLMITYTGIVTIAFTLMPWCIASAYKGDEMRFYV